MTKAGWPRRLHRTADRIDRRIRPALGAAPSLEALWIKVLDGIVARQPDRSYLRKSILPALARSRPARLLFVGVRGYTRTYADAFLKTETEFWTSDIDPTAAQYGAPGRHATVDVCRLEEAFSPDFFDAVVMNGVFGWGVDDPHDMNRALVATQRVLAPGGLLLLGWNKDRCPDPDTLPAVALFEANRFGGLPQRKEFPDVTHLYAWYKKRS